MARYLCDSNVFYDLSANPNLLRNLSARGTIHWSPLTLLELAGKWRARTHAVRKAAATAIISSLANGLPDPDGFLDSKFGFPPRHAAPPWQSAVQAMATSRNISQLRAGVPHIPSQTLIRVGTGVASRWRRKLESDWVRNFHAIIESENPKFTKWLQDRTRPVPGLRAQLRDPFLKKINEPVLLEQIAMGLVVRSLQAQTLQDVQTANLGRLTNIAAVEFAPFAAVYKAYLTRLITEQMLPQENDCWDIEFFLYLADGDVTLVTSDDRWLTLAARAGLGARVIRPE